MAQGKTGSSPPPGGLSKPGSQLDSMLGSLQSDLNKLGVATVAKGVCGACKKPIAGQVRRREGGKLWGLGSCLHPESLCLSSQVVTAMGKTWHPEHFVCTHCQEEIGSRNFFERDGQPYCEKDYHSLFSPRCYYCNGPILDVSAHMVGARVHSGALSLGSVLFRKSQPQGSPRQEVTGLSVALVSHSSPGAR